MHTVFTELKIEILDMVAEGDKVVSRKHILGTHTGALFGIAPKGKKGTIQIIGIFTISDGRLKKHWAENNFRKIIQSLQV
ncbi:MAG: ester cyclase [Flavobacterium sp.]